MDDLDKRAAGLALGAIRRGQGLRQADVAERLRPVWRCRVDAREVSRFEQGISRMRLDAARFAAWCDILGTTTEAALTLGRGLLPAPSSALPAPSSALPVPSSALPAPSAAPLCELCGERPPTCVGAYGGEPEARACDECCTHGQRGGFCRPIAP